MALQLKKRDGVYYAVGTVGGKRIRKSLGTSDFAKAKEKKVTLETNISSVINEPKFKDNFVMQNRNVRTSWNNKISYHTTPAPPFEDIADKYILSPRTGSSKSSRHYAEFHKKHFGQIPIDQITEETVEEYIESYHLAQGNTDGTIRRDLVALQSVLNFGAKLGYREEISLTKPSDNPHSTETVTEEEQKIIFSHLSEEANRLCVFIVNTGSRPIEALRLTGKDINFRERLVTLRSKKGKGSKERSRQVPMNDVVLELIGSDIEKHSHVFDQAWHRERLGKHFVDACDKAKVLDKTLYCLRHTFATRLARNGVHPKVLADLLGNSLVMVERYMNMTLSDHRNAVMSL
ncbi:MAG: hypothetical protein CMF29_08545 [Kiritimatiellaceae bacterium]|nr:hypothetical protein [Kiritimatiellaceae bacterium]